MRRTIPNQLLPSDTNGDATEGSCLLPRNTTTTCDDMSAKRNCIVLFQSPARRRPPILLVEFDISAKKLVDIDLHLLDRFHSNPGTKQNSIGRIQSVVFNLVTINLQDFPIITSNYVAITFGDFRRFEDDNGRIGIILGCLAHGRPPFVLGQSVVAFSRSSLLT